MCQCELEFLVWVIVVGFCCRVEDHESCHTVTASGVLATDIRVK